MIIIDDIIISDEILENEFVCNLNACKGACCVKGDSGAPLEKEEAEILEQIYNTIEPFLSEEGKEAIQQQGKWVIAEGEQRTPLIKNQACAYTVFDEKGTAQCGIEKSYNAGLISFKKPISCHLYPIRVKKNKDFKAMNYSEWDICDPACSLGKELSIPVYKFLKEPLIRKYGEEFYKVLKQLAEQQK